MGLFRKEALEAHRDRLHGQVVLLPHWPHTLVCLFLFLWVAAAAVFLTQASFSRKETVRGWLEPADGLVQVFPRSEGELARLLVSPGDSVITGQPLAVINGDRVLADGARLEGVLLAEYQTQKATLERQLLRASELAELRQRELEKAIVDAGATLDAQSAQLDTLERRAALVQKRIDRHSELAARGHITEAELDTLREQALRLAGEQQQVAAAHSHQVARFNSLQSELARLPGESADVRDRLRLSLSDLSQEIARLRGNRAHVLLAPVDGTVNRIDLRPGERARYERALITLVPAESALVAKLLIPVPAAGLVSRGQHLWIRYDAFPYQKYGMHDGVLREVSRSALMPADQAGLPISAQEPVFRAIALPHRSAVDAHGNQYALKPGMTLSADIVLEERSLLEWLLEPLYSLRGKLV